MIRAFGKVYTAMSEQLPRPIQGGYLLLKVIGKGGMGVVYKGFIRFLNVKSP